MTHISIYRYICNYVYTYINNQCISYIYWNYNQSLIDPFNIVKGWKYSWEKHGIYKQLVINLNDDEWV